MVNLILSLILAYLIGSIPTSYMLTKFLKKKDIRKHGSGNAGATNVFRVAGKIPALAVLLFDMLKGAFSVAFLPEIFLNNMIGVTLGAGLYRMLLGVCAIAGHVWNVFLKFKGGKGVATTAGVLFMLAPKVFAGSFIVWLIVFLISRVVSIASIIAAVFLPVFALIFTYPIDIVLFCVLLCIIGTYKHKDNIKRLIRGEERKLFVLSFALLFGLTQFALGNNLYAMFKDKPVIKVYLEEVKNGTKEPAVDTSVFKDIFLKVLPERLNIKFDAAQASSDADVVITAEIKGYIFAKSVLPTFYSVWAVVADTAAPKSGARMIVDYEVFDPKDGKLLGEFKNFTTDERCPINDMVGDKAFRHAAAKNINRFIYRAFYKQRKKM